MNKQSNSISPFLILLIPAMLVCGIYSVSDLPVKPEKAQASAAFKMPSFKNFVKVIF